MVAVGKALQRSLYNLLLDKTAFFALLALAALVVISALQFGQAILDWSSDKYSEVFNSFSDNLSGRSMQGKLCMYVPIDVVYTWVNGSDPQFLDDLKHAKEKRSYLIGRTPLRDCPFLDCVPSHLLLLDRRIDHSSGGDRVEKLLREQNPLSLRDMDALEDPHLVCGSHVENRTALVFGSGEAASEALNVSGGGLVSYGLETFNVSQAYWTTEWTVPNSFPMPSYFMLHEMPEAATEEKIARFLPQDLKRTVTDIWLVEVGKKDKKKVAVIHSSNASLVSQFLEEHDDLDIGGGVSIKTSAANLIVELPKFVDDEAHQPKRFADFDQLRYSMRSVERFAPWVRHIFLVTNGQIPHWLNMDHPRLTVITHEDIFEDMGHLPTFSSPAIETNIHRIPGLSEKFLYFNDDVLLGKEVWPEDFYTENDGTKIRWSWPLPDCSPNCPSSWIKDGYCDKSCNTSECMFDGGDCEGEYKLGFGDPSLDHLFHFDDSVNRPLCNLGCLDNWLADKFCDDSCNVADCAFDAGDCGTSNFAHLHEESFFANEVVDRANYSHLISSPWKPRFVLPPGTTVAFWNVSSVFRFFDEVGLVPSDHRAVRSLALSDEHRVMSVVLHENVSEASVNITLQAKNNKTIVIHEFSISCNTSGHVPVKKKTATKSTTTVLSPIVPARGAENNNILPRELEEVVGDDVTSLNLTQVDESRLNLSVLARSHLGVLRQQLEREEITIKGFNVKRSHLLRPFVQAFVNGGGQLASSSNASSSNSSSSLLLRALLWIHDDEDYVSDDEHHRLKVPPPPRIPQRQLLDSYGESLLHVNRLISGVYGHAQRSVPAHIPHFVDLGVLNELQERFAEEWAETSARTFRHGQDMQFSFSYVHFLLNEKRNFSAGEIFDQFDTDQSRTWSDREIRTLLTRIHSLPLYLEVITEFEGKIIKCADRLPSSLRDVDPAPPPYERYFDSKLPVVSRALVVQCTEISLELEERFRDRHRYKHKVVSESESAFKTLTSNLSHVVRELDNLRKSPAKFVCINDDTDPTREGDNKMVHAVLVDYFESILPVPSSFELPAQFRNKYLHLSELSRWNLYRSLLRWAAMLSLCALVVTTVLGFLGVDVGEVCWNCCCRRVFSLFTPPMGRRTTVRHDV